MNLSVRWLNVAEVLLSSSMTSRLVASFASWSAGSLPSRLTCLRIENGLSLNRLASQSKVHSLPYAKIPFVNIYSSSSETLM